ncbi:helix-turn-helix domain-containing protein [Marinicella litoralis]|uniref:AraC family transcriptional regulator n=2 Tax=Marinicella litoralis TaxID=644220 RepID=A0A4R6XIR6_9GAMM|nr:helix-turn-helix domain-containing protein [Marinicella litoralis]TDR19362.1 AraC family transcriptional regulator [Marinicella litoralis]
MPVTFSLFEILIIIGLSQGLITASLLLTTQDKQLGKKILGVTVLVFCIANCRVLLHSSDLWDVPAFRFFPVGMELFLPPLVYLYLLSLTETDFHLRRKYLLYFMPGLFFAIYDIALYIMVVGLESLQAKDQVATSFYFNSANQIEDHLIVVMTLFFIAAGGRKVYIYLTWLKQFKDYHSFPIYRWLRSLIMWFVLLGLVLMINQSLDSLAVAMEVNTFRWRFFNLLLAFVTYYLGFMGYKQAGLKIHDSKLNLVSLSKKLSKDRVSVIEQKLLDKLTNEAVYLDPSLTLKTLATDMEVSAENLSMVVNQKFEMSFRDLLNKYRVSHVKTKMQQSLGNQSTILNLALDSGFNSQASFYRAFKKFEGTSPKAYIDKIS